jgi:Rieske Fe-S protein
VTTEPGRDTRATRRGVLAGVGLAGLAGAASACSSGGSGAQATGSGPSAGAPAAGAPAAGGTSASNPSAGGNAAKNILAATSDIPVGGGKVFSGQQIVVTQPAAGEFKAFSAVCTHMQCIVDQVANGTIDCPCHGSEFSIKDGSVVAGPAPRPLPAQHIKVTGNEITLA